MNPSVNRLARDISFKIEEDLQMCGIFFRIFSRAKTNESIESKLQIKNYENTNKLMQDIIGIRITLYFEDDVPIVYQILKQKFDFNDETVDEMDISTFEPQRINLIFNMKENHAKEIKDIFVKEYKYIDTTYEVQLRTVLSEGWHEVEHDLRYKCKDDWVDHSDISHIFNGIYASLVTSDWSILSIFEKLAYKHYKSKNWAAMIRNKFRLRLKDNNLNEKIINILNTNENIAKDLFKIDRTLLVNNMFNDGIKVPLTISNLIYIINAYFLNCEKIYSITPEFIKSNKKLYKNMDELNTKR